MTAKSLVLVHGWGGSYRDTWQGPGIDQIFADVGHSVSGIDLLGHGEADKPHDPDAYAGLPSYLLERMPDEPCIVVGFSLGALTTLRAAIASPDRFCGIVLAGIGNGVFEPHKPEETARILAGIDGTAPTDDNIARLFGQYARQGNNDVDALTAVLKRPPSTPLAPEQLSVVTCPVLVCIGERDFASPSDRLAAAFPDGALNVLPRTDHFATPGSFSFIDAVVGFLESRFAIR
ncbi:MAG: alpha/beta fold hydrolase [Actinomycetota bacterium]